MGIKYNLSVLAFALLDYLTFYIKLQRTKKYLVDVCLVCLIKPPFDLGGSYEK